MTRQVQTLQISKMKNSSNKKEARPSVNRESIELLPKNEIKIDKVITGNVTYNISVENLITAQEDETRNKKKKKSCLDRLKDRVANLLS
jgi:hypothetical protein